MLSMGYTYNYPYSSGLKESASGTNLQLASYTTFAKSNYFFEGEIGNPALLSQQLGLLHRIVQTHFFKPMPSQLDPVVTSSQEYLRFEGFSTCCGVYVRLDAKTDAFSIRHLNKGTTNVDFNASMQIALAKLQNSKKSSLQIGSEEFVLNHGDETAVEKRVKLPLRWLKGFGEIQNIQSKLEFKFEISTGKSLHWFRRIPKGRGSAHPVHVGIRNGQLHSSQRSLPGGVKVSGLLRLKVLEPLLASNGKLTVWADNELGVSAWTIESDLGRFTIVISPDLYRGFSGEGQLLSYLTDSCNINQEVRAQLNWSSEVTAKSMAEQLNVNPGEIHVALQQLSAEGLLGYDLMNEAYFHRELPFDMKSIQQIQPRLKGANKLVDDNAVLCLSNDVGNSIYKISSKDTEYRVVLSSNGDQCSCPWFSKYLGNRGACKHILAAQIYEKD